jgi:hypothetical protein
VKAYLLLPNSYRPSSSGKMPLNSFTNSKRRIDEETIVTNGRLLQKIIPGVVSVSEVLFHHLLLQ